jgi:hypothetical protein
LRRVAASAGGSGPPSVLVAEDDPVITTQLVRGLRLAGYETSSVATGREVLSSPAADVAACPVPIRRRGVLIVFILEGYPGLCKEADLSAFRYR